MNQGRVPPHDLDAEAAVISAMLLDPDAIDLVRELLEPAHFYAESNRRICEAIYLLRDAAEPVDLVTVTSKLRDAGRLAQVGGTPYVAALSDATPAVGNVRHHARVVREKAKVRQVIATCQVITAEGYCEITDPEAWCDQAEAKVFAATHDGSSDQSVELVSDAMPRFLDALSERQKTGTPPGLNCGWSMLNHRIGGLLPYVYVVAGRPGMGKSALAAGLALNVARAGRGVAIVSLEMDRDQILERMVGVEARVPLKRIEHGDLNAQEYARVIAAAARLAKLPIAIAYKPGATIGQVRAIVRRQARELEAKHNVKLALAAVDYLQLMNDQRVKGQTRDEAIGGLMRGLVGLAGELHIPVIVVSQVNRQVESRSNKDKRPTMADLRESGNIEQDAHGIFFVYRDDYYFRDSPDAGLAEIIIAKLRNGSPGSVKLKWTGEYTAFDTLEAVEGEDYDDFDNERAA